MTREGWERDALDEPEPVWEHMLRTAGGAYVNPLELQPQDVAIEDVARALSHLCRFGGHVPVFYSVAQHSVIVSCNVGPDNALWGLLHDGGEAYMLDMPRPIKVQPAMREYRAAEARAMRAVAHAFGLVLPQPLEVTIADQRALATEDRDVRRLARVECTVAPFDEVIKPMPPDEAMRVFLQRFDELTR
jgi:hypothetical protein